MIENIVFHLLLRELKKSGGWEKEVGHFVLVKDEYPTMPVANKPARWCKCECLFIASP